MAVGAGYDVARWYMILAFGLFGRNGFCSVLEWLIVRKFCIIGPHLPCESSENASRTVFASSKSLIIVSPGIDRADGLLVSMSILLRLYFSLSLFWRCLSAMAVDLC